MRIAQTGLSWISWYHSQPTRPDPLLHFLAQTIDQLFIGHVLAFSTRNWGWMLSTSSLKIRHLAIACLNLFLRIFKNYLCALWQNHVKKLNPLLWFCSLHLSPAYWVCFSQACFSIFQEMWACWAHLLHVLLYHHRHHRSCLLPSCSYRPEDAYFAFCCLLASFVLDVKYWYPLSQPG